MTTQKLIDAIDKTLQYYADEYPKATKPEVWDMPCDIHAGGVTPNQLVEIKADLTQPFACPDGLSCSGDGSDCVGQYRCEPSGDVGEALDDINHFLSECVAYFIPSLRQGDQARKDIVKAMAGVKTLRALSQQPDAAIDNKTRNE